MYFNLDVDLLEAASSGSKVNRARRMRGTHNDQCPTLIKLAEFRLVTIGIVEVSVGYASESSCAADIKGDFLIAVGLEIAILVQRFNRDERQILAVGMKRVAVGCQTQFRRRSGGSEIR